MCLAREKKMIFKVISLCLAFTMAYASFVPFEALAARSRAGGGEIAKPDWDKVAKNVGITVATVVVSSFLQGAFNQGWNSTGPQMGQIGSNVGDTGFKFGQVVPDLSKIPTELTANLAANGAAFQEVTGGFQIVANLPQITQSTGVLASIGNGIVALPSNLTHAFNAGVRTIVDPGCWGAGWNTITSLETVMPTVIKGYAAFASGTQVARAVGMMGQYYEWSPATTYIISNVATGMNVGLLNPQGALGKTFNQTGGYGGQMLKGMVVGGLGGYATGATIYSIDGDKIKNNESPGTGAQIAGMATGMVATEFGRTLVNPDTYKNVVAQFNNRQLYDFDHPSESEVEIYERLPHDDFGKGAYARQTQAGLEILSPESPEEVAKMDKGPFVHIKSMQDSSIKVVGNGEELEVIHGKPLEQCYVRSDVDPKDAAKYREVKYKFDESAKTYESVKGVWMAIDEDGVRNPSDILSPDKVQELQNTPGVKVEFADTGGQLKVAVGKPEITYLQDARSGNVVVPADDLNRMQGRNVLDRAFESNPAYRDLRSADGSLGKILSDERTQITKNGGNVHVRVPGNKQKDIPALEFDITTGQYNYARNTMPGVMPDSIMMPTGAAPTNAQIASRIFLDPFIKVADQWPILASRALALNAYKKVASSKDDEEWAPAVSDIVFSASISLLDTAANLWSLKPSLRFNTDEKLGLIPETKYQQAALFNNATVHRYVNEVAKLSDNASEQDIKNMLAKLKFDENEQDEIWRAYAKLPDNASEQDIKDMLVRLKSMDKYQQTKVLTNLIASKLNTDNTFDNSINKFKGIGGTRTEIMLSTVWNAARYDLPLNLISGAIDVEVNRHIKDDDFQRVLGRIAVSSIARGVAWYLYSEGSRAIAEARMNKGEPNPYQIAAALTLQDPVEIMSERREGNLPVPDSRKFDIATNGKIYTVTDPETGELIYDLTGRADMTPKEFVGKYAIPLMKALKSEDQREEFLSSINAFLSDPNASIEDLQKKVRQYAKIESDKKNEFLDNISKDRELKYVYRVFTSNIQEWLAVKEPKDGKGKHGVAPNVQLDAPNPQTGVILYGKHHPEDRLRVSTDEFFVPNAKRFTQDGVEDEYIEPLAYANTGPNATPLNTFGPNVSLQDIQKEFKQRYAQDREFRANVDNNPDLKKKYNEFINGQERVVGAGQSARKEYTFKPKAIPITGENVGNLKKLPGLTIHGGKISLLGLAAYDDNGRPQFGQLYNLPKVPSLTSTIMGSLNQSMFEFAWQSLAMGLPLTKDGKMSAYVWNNYVWSSPQSLHSLTAAAAGRGLFDTMTQYSTIIGKDVIGRNILTTLPDVPLVNKYLGLAPFVGVKDFRGMPFTLAVQVETGFKAQNTLFYLSWPYQRLSVIPHDSFWRSLKIGISKQVSGRTVLPDNNESETEPVDRDKPVIPDNNVNESIQQEKQPLNRRDLI